MYKIKIKDANITTDKYLWKTSSMSGDSIKCIFDNEKELAYYCFCKEMYQLNLLGSVCTYNDLFDQEGKKINSKQLDQIIEKYFPDETKVIKTRMDAFKKIGYKQLIQLGIMDFWLTKQKEILNNLPEETKQFVKEIETKSQEYINIIFPPPTAPKKFKKI